MAGNLTRGEARDRARLLTVESYHVDLDLTTGPETFVSDTTIRFGCGEPGSSTFVDLHGAKVREITLNGQRLDHPPSSLAEFETMIAQAQKKPGGH